MSLEARIREQRVQHIVLSYQLAGADTSAFVRSLDRLLDQHSSYQVELVLAEILVKNWSIVPLPRGTVVLDQAQQRLVQIDHVGCVPHITPSEFRHITGLHPGPVFNGLPPESIVPQATP